MEARSVASNASSTAFKLQLVFNPVYPKVLLKSLYKSWQEGEFCDITLHVGDQSIRAHKNVLASLSEYFKVLLHMDAQNTSDVKLHDVDFGCLELLLKFAYTGSVEVTGDNVQNLFIVADYLQVEFVKTSCQRLLLKSVDKSNCVSMLLFAQKFYLENIKKRCFDLIGRNLEEVIQSEEFLSIPYDCVLDLISNDSLIVFRGGYPLPNSLNELAILKAAICYIIGQTKETKLSEEQTYSLVVASRLIYIDYSDWEKTVESHSDILLTENFTAVRQYLLDHKDVINKTFLMTIKNCRSPFHWVVRQDEENTKIVPDRKKYGFKTEFSVHVPGYFDKRSQISKIVIVTQYIENQRENVIVGLHVFDDYWHHHGVERNSSEVADVLEVELERGEVIVKVKLRAESLMIHCLTFITNHGRSLGHFGGILPPTVTLEPPPNFGGYLHSFSWQETEYWGNKCMVYFNVNWACHRNIDNPDCISNWDMTWQDLNKEESEDDFYKYTSSDEYPYYCGEESDDESAEEREEEVEEEDSDV